MTDLHAPLEFARGPAMKNRFMLAPMTNCQSHPDGRLSDDERRWLVKRAEGGFGLTMTCAAHVQAVGQGFPGQLGVFGDQHVEGLARLADELRAAGSRSAVQLHHAGRRAPEKLIGQQPVAPSDCEETGARALTLTEVEALVEDFVLAAERSDRAGFDGVEIHGAHDYVLCEFLSPATNRREDRYGGSPENRARLVHEIIDGIRARCRADFQVGLRLSPERYGLRLAEMLALSEQVMLGGQLEYLDVSLWDASKEPEEEGFAGQSLMGLFTALERGATRLGVAGKIASRADAGACLDAGCDFVLIGRAAILHHDFPERVRDAAFRPQATPVTREYLRGEALGEAFIDYLSRWPDFIAD